MILMVEASARAGTVALTPIGARDRGAFFVSIWFHSLLEFSLSDNRKFLSLIIDRIRTLTMEVNKIDTPL